MAINKYYVINKETNYVENVALFHEQDAERMGLIEYPKITTAGLVGPGWTYLPNDNTFLPPTIDPVLEQQYQMVRKAEAWYMLRAMRNELLVESDVWVLPDRWATYTQDEKIAWTLYRQALRDLPATVTDPFNYDMPQKPFVEQMTKIPVSGFMG